MIGKVTEGSKPSRGSAARRRRRGADHHRRRRVDRDLQAADGRGRRAGGRRREQVRLAQAALLLPLVLERVRASGVDEIVVVAGRTRTRDRRSRRRLRRVGARAGRVASLRARRRSRRTSRPPSSSSPTGPTSPGAIDRVVAAWRETGAEIVAASYGGDRGHPVLLARAAWSRVPDEGARALEPAARPLRRPRASRRRRFGR